MKVCGVITKQMDAEHSGMCMETSMKVTGLMTKRTAMEFIRMPTVPNIRVSGRMTYRMDRVLRNGRMGVVLRVATKRDVNMVLVVICGQTEVATQEIG